MNFSISNKLELKDFFRNLEDFKCISILILANLTNFCGTLKTLIRTYSALK